MDGQDAILDIQWLKNFSVRYRRRYPTLFGTVIQAHEQPPVGSSYFTTMYRSLLLVLAFSSIAVSESIIKTLPGLILYFMFKGADIDYQVLSDKVCGVGKSDDIQLFYYFIESERNPSLDPLMLWLTGGPGCSAFSGLVYEIGPLIFDYANRSGDIPALLSNPYSWTKVASIIFLDSPVGSGFSYAQSSEGYRTSDSLAAAHGYDFLKKWLIDHPEFLRNRLYIAGDSYSGLFVPIIAQKISDGNEAGQEPHMNLNGYLLGNALVDENIDFNSRVPFAHRMTFLSDKLYKKTEASCNGKYLKADPSNGQCTENLKVVNKCMEKINLPHVLEPKCGRPLSWKPNALKWESIPLEENFSDFLLSPIRQLPEPTCRLYKFLFSYIWANDRRVQKALGIREGTIPEWVRCNNSLAYTHDVFSTVAYIQKLHEKGYGGLIYSGDHDMLVPHMGTQEWINSLNLSISKDWEPWFVDGQVAGFSIEYSNSKRGMTFATVKGGGHTAPEYKPKECLAMIYRWLAYYPL
ncbi:Serine carboxypeptidase-like 18 [Vitis vinifera]|uniref:Serine carboxypeptidase-like 18 n=1 Tax=Vitis vinifera TaxID=29760 RepID=A0A438HDE9_VITVI|nr:Serine carboxypeptidase-like 18 [Vitis vinifera]